MAGCLFRECVLQATTQMVSQPDISRISETILNQPNGTQILPFAGATAWSFTRAYMFPASYLKLREIVITYQLPAKLIQKAKLQNASISLYSRNIILWTAAKINIDPENAFQPSTDVQGSGTQFKQGIERYNVLSMGDTGGL